MCGALSINEGAAVDERSFPFMSVVIPVYNGTATIGRALMSLLAQDYPSDRYEIIVVNDGSTDDTARVVATFPAVRYVELPANAGIPTAQNAGLAAARGEIYVAFNDDFRAAPDFLSQLADGYAQLADPMGVGGVVVKRASSEARGLVASYMEATRSGAAPQVVSIRPAFLPSAIKRLLTYIFCNFASVRRAEPQGRAYQEVVELYGANASFPISLLRHVGGWDESAAAPAIGGIEDRDICFRMRLQFPNLRFYVMHSAHIMADLDPNDPSVSMKSYVLRRPYRRGPFNYAFHVKNGLMPQLFPFPPLILLMLLVDAALAPMLLPLLICLVPQLCYGWWPYRAVVERRQEYILFPYLQAVEEAMVLTGFFRGFILHAKRTKREVPRNLLTDPSGARTPGELP
jgi:glycosyltransferase involved in cell wall biosynthesis